MFLKSIEMQGFKSFADKIYLDFNLGITAIVGPNGSGKSNISDAIRWVMGEQSAKTLRGAKMEDVIFAGTQERSALGFAEVSLTLDNSDGVFELDFPEITVTRRVYRSGEGEYFINKTSCRLKDIHELFMDTGIGREGYSIIGQGKIDEILSTKSEDRRQIFEEAAGITKYKYRKNEAEKKLSQTNDNLLRVSDILTELDGQLATLEQQSEKAKKFLILRDELRVLEVNEAVKSIDAWREELTTLEKDLQTLTNQINEIQQKTDEADKAVQSMYEEISSIDAEVEQKRTDEHNTELQINEFNNEISLISANIDHTEDNIKRLKEETEKEKKTISDMDKQIRQNELQLDEYQKKKALMDSELEKINAQLKIANQNSSTKGEKLEALRTELVNQNAYINDCRSKINNMSVLLESFEGRRTVLNEELTQREADYKRLKDNIAALKDELKQKTAEFEKENAEFEKLIQAKRKEEDLFRQAQEDLNRINAELINKRSKQKMIEDMQREYDGYTKSVKSVMEAHRDGSLGKLNIYGPVAQLIQTKSKYVTAIDIALGSANQNIIVQTDQDAKAAITYLKQNRLGRATFLPISAVKGRSINNSEVKSMSGYIAMASELVECEDKYREIISNLLGATVVAENIDSAIAMAKKTQHKIRIVTLEGDVLQPGGAMTGGSTGKSGGFLSRTNEVAILKKEIAQLSKICQSKEEEAEKLRITSEKLALQEEDGRKTLAEKKELLIKLSSEAEHTEEFFASITDGKSQLEKELSDIGTQISDIIAERENIQSQIAKAEITVKQAEEDMQRQQAEFAEFDKKNAELNQRLVDYQIDLNALIKDIDVVHHVIQNLNHEKSEFFEDIQNKQEEVVSLKARILDLKDDIKFKMSQIEEHNQKIEEYRSDTALLLQKKKDTEDKIRKSQEDTKNTREQLFSLGQQQAKTEGRQNRIESELEAVTNRLWEEYELTYTEAAKLRDSSTQTVKNSGKRIAELKSEIKGLGNINIDAIEEYKSVKERFDFLTDQTQDLQKAKEELEQLISDMLKIMKKQFAQQFELINKNFNSVFSELFGGGQAKLILEDPSSLLESGIEIEAQPPGKKLQRLSLLSGGERAFTAIALLFAILKVRPTPFCILDEIEAALDDVNVSRYAAFLKRFSKKTQFIVVTHRRGTMEAANILYGVTMQEHGVSKLLSLNIDEVAN